MVPSPKVATYDLQPEMNAGLSHHISVPPCLPLSCQRLFAAGVADAMVTAVKEGKHPFMVCNFAPPDMVSVPMCESNMGSLTRLNRIAFAYLRSVILVCTIRPSLLRLTPMSRSERLPLLAKSMTVRRTAV